jgi:LuxR family maltose regulon positive regulatory protein
MRDDAELAVSLSQGAPATERAHVLLQLGVALWLTGDNEAALRALTEAEAEGVVGHVLARVHATGFQALVLADEGNLAEARARTAAGLQVFEEAGLSWELPTYSVLLAEARLHACDADKVVAQRVATIDRIIRQGVPTFYALLSDLLLGELFLERGDLAEAARRMHAGLVHLKSWPDAGILGPRLQRLRERLEQLRLLEPLTPAERRVLELLPTQLSLNEIAARLWVSTNTVRTHVRSIFRKLEVHSRSEAVERARQFELFDTR